MGKYDREIASSQKMLEEAQASYNDSLIKMAGAAHHVRQHVLDYYQSQIDEATEMIRIFTDNG